MFQAETVTGMIPQSMPCVSAYTDPWGIHSAAGLIGWSRTDLHFIQANGTTVTKHEFATVQEKLGNSLWSSVCVAIVVSVF